MKRVIASVIVALIVVLSFVTICCADDVLNDESLEFSIENTYEALVFNYNAISSVFPDTIELPTKTEYCTLCDPFNKMGLGVEIKEMHEKMIGDDIYTLYVFDNGSVGMLALVKMPPSKASVPVYGLGGNVYQARWFLYDIYYPHTVYLNVRTLYNSALGVYYFDIGDLLVFDITIDSPSVTDATYLSFVTCYNIYRGGAVNNLVVFQGNAFEYDYVGDPNDIFGVQITCSANTSNGSVTAGMSYAPIF